MIACLNSTNNRALRFRPAPLAQSTNTPELRIYHAKSSIDAHLATFSKQSTPGEPMNASVVYRLLTSLFDHNRLYVLYCLSNISGQQSIWHSASRADHEAGLASSAIYRLWLFKAEPVRQTDCRLVFPSAAFRLPTCLITITAAFQIPRRVLLRQVAR